MHYLVLLHDVERAELAPGTPGWDDDMVAFERFGELAGEAIVGGEALTPSDQAVVVRPSRGLVTDGPFAEIAEVLGGTFVLAADDLDAVLDLAAAIPTARTGTLEVRPIVGEWPEPADAPPGTTRYLAVLHGTPTEADVPGTSAWDDGAAAHGRFAAAHRDQVLGGVALHPPETATTLQVRDGRRVLTDGPFAETTEVIGGVYVLAAATPDDAVAVAGAIPVGDGAVELRPILELEG